MCLGIYPAGGARSPHRPALRPAHDRRLRPGLAARRRPVGHGARADRPRDRPVPRGPRGPDAARDLRAAGQRQQAGHAGLERARRTQPLPGARPRQRRARAVRQARAVHRGAGARRARGRHQRPAARPLAGRSRRRAGAPRRSTSGARGCARTPRPAPPTCTSSSTSAARPAPRCRTRTRRSTRWTSSPPWWRASASASVPTRSGRWAGTCCRTSSRRRSSWASGSSPSTTRPSSWRPTAGGCRSSSCSPRACPAGASRTTAPPAPHCCTTACAAWAGVWATSRR